MEKPVNCYCRCQEELLLDNFNFCTGSQRKHFQMTENAIEGKKHKRKNTQTCLTLDWRAPQEKLTLIYPIFMELWRKIVKEQAELHHLFHTARDSQSLQWQNHCDANHLTAEKLRGTDNVLREVARLPGVGLYLKAFLLNTTRREWNDSILNTGRDHGSLQA